MNKVIYPTPVITAVLRTAHKRLQLATIAKMLDHSFFHGGIFNYVLDESFQIAPCSDVDLFYEWSKLADKFGLRHVARTQISDVDVSTVFLGTSSLRAADGGPGLFETMIFGGEYDESEFRWSSWSEAKKGHALVCQMVVKGEDELRSELI